MQTCVVLQRLKADTADLHQRVERRLPIFSDDFDLTAYATLIELFYGYWAPLEQRLCGASVLQDPALDFSSRLKAHLLAADLKVLGTDAANVARCPMLPQTDTAARALGSLYVLEGSTMGAQFIARHIRDRFQVESGSGGSFFNAYGASAGSRWAEFRRFVSSRVEPGSADDAVGAARETFETLDNWLARCW